MSVLLDANVVSEPFRKSPAAIVSDWAERHSPRELFISAVGEAELRYSPALMAEGRRKRALIGTIDRMIGTVFLDRVLPFDGNAPRAYADMAALRRPAGRPVHPMDCQIAAVAMSRGMAVATRNVRDFENMGVELVDPRAGA